MEESRFKVITHVPVQDADSVRQAAGAAGAGRQGKYTNCSFSVRGKGRFVPGKGANPHIGESGLPEIVEEELIEFICEQTLINKVIQAISKAHPYEEVPIEVYKLENY